MKSHIILIASALLALTSCGTTASFTQAAGQQKYQDGIYYRPQSLSLEEQAAKLSETDELIAKTKSSAVFVKTVGKVDTLLIPENMSAQFKFNHKDSTTTVSLFNDYDSFYDWSWGLSPFRYGRWYDPFWGPGWAMSPWAFNSWRYSSWYWGFHDPFWYDPFWYDPYWYDPFWGPSWGWSHSIFWGDPFWGPFSYMYPMGYGYGYYGGYFGYFNRYDRGFHHGHMGHMATRSSDSRIAAQPRRGVGRVVRTGAASSAADRTISKTSQAARISTASRPTSSSVRSTTAASVQRQPGVARSGMSSSSAAGVVRSSSPSGVSRSGSPSGSTYRRSVPSTGSSSGSISRGSGSISRGSGGSSRPSTGGSVSSGSYSSSRSGGYSGSSSSSSVSRSAGSFSSSGGGSVSRGSGGGGRR